MAAPPLNTILQSMKRIEDTGREQPRLWNPAMQTELMGSVPVGSMKLGPTLMSTPESQHRDVFLSNYVQPSDGIRNMQAAVGNAIQVRNTVVAPDNSMRTCRVFPPLLVRYGGAQDEYIPVELHEGGEIHKTRSIPDLIINFHADTHAITLTTCTIDPKKIKEFEIAMMTMYSMTTSDPGAMLTLERFTQMYDLRRLEVLQAIKLA